MPTELLDRVFYGNTARTWLIALAALVVAFVVLLLLRRFVGARLAAVAKRTTNLVDDLLADLVARTKATFLFILALPVAIRVLRLPPNAYRVVQYFALLVALVQLAIWLNGAIGFWVKSYLERKRAAADTTSVSTIGALGIAAKAAVWAILFITALRTVFKVDVTALVTGLGIGGIAIALAVQNVLGDLLAALSIIFDKPFDVGDFIVVDQVSGTVEHIGLKTTRIRSLSGEQVIVSNSELLKSRIRNYKRMYERRVVFFTDVTYDTPPERVARIPAMIRETIVAQPLTRFDRSHFATFMDSALRIETVYWVLDPDYVRYMDIQQTINLELLRRFNEEGIAFAFPSRTVYVQSDTPSDAAALVAKTS